MRNEVGEELHATKPNVVGVHYTKHGDDGGGE